MTAETESKYLTVAARIEAELYKGAWDGKKMPSVRGVAAQHGISVVTASRALQVLRDKGLIQTIERSGCYRIPPPSADRWAVCQRITPSSLHKQTLAVVESGFVQLSRREAMHLSFDAFDLRPGLTAGEAEVAAEKAKADGIKGVFLLPSRVSEADAAADVAFLNGCAAAGLPVVLLERAVRGERHLSTDLVAIDDVSAARECTSHLHHIGRKRVGIVVASPVSSHEDRVAGYLFEMHAHRKTLSARKAAPPDVVIYQPSDMPNKEAYVAIAEQILSHDLDGVICYQDYLAVGLIIELLQRRVSVPKQVAVIGFDNLPLGNEFSLGLTTYDYPSEGMAEQAVRLMKSRIQQPGRPPVKVLVPGKLVVRQSTMAV